MVTLTKEAAGALLTLYQAVHRCATIGGGREEVSIPDGTKLGRYRFDTHGEELAAWVIGARFDIFAIPKADWEILRKALQAVDDLTMLDSIGSLYEVEGQ